VLQVLVLPDDGPPGDVLFLDVTRLSQPIHLDLTRC